MNAKMNETQSWYCDICDKRISFSSRLRHIISKSRKHKTEYKIVVREYGFIRPQFDELRYILTDTIKDCKHNFFPSFDCRCVYDIKFIKTENIEEVIISITLEQMKYKSQFYGFKKSQKWKKVLF